MSTSRGLRRGLVLAASGVGGLAIVAVGVVTVRPDMYKLAMLTPAEAANFGLDLYDTMTPANEARAIPFFEKACNRGEPLGCTGLGIANFDGNGGLSKNYERARELLDPACEKGVLRACRKVANCYAFALGTTKDVPRAMALWTRACDGGEARACHMLGDMHASPDAPPELRDPKLALTLFRKACAGGYKDGCDQASVVEAAGAIKVPTAASAPDASVLRCEPAAPVDDFCVEHGYGHGYSCVGGTIADVKEQGIGCQYIDPIMLTTGAPKNLFCCEKAP